MTTHSTTPGAVAHAEGQDNGQAHETLTPSSIPQPEVIDYAFLKAEAKRRRVSVDDMTALATGNDPYYCGTRGDWTGAEWFREVWERGGFTYAHLRRIHYWCVSQGDLLKSDGLVYENTDPCWKWLCRVAKAARYLGVVPVEAISDNKAPDPRIYARYDRQGPSYHVYPPALSSPDVFVDGFSVEAVQPYHLEVWIEKSTMNDVLEPICERLHANLITAEGEFSLASANTAVKKRFQEAGKPVRVFMLSDFDPAGKSIPVALARKLEFFAREIGQDIRVTQLCLTREQVERYRLPRIPLKDTEKRASAFEALYGPGAVELDALEALHPGVLAQIVNEALAPFYDEEAARKVRIRERELYQVVRDEAKAIMARYQPQIEALEPMRDELRNITIPDVYRFLPEPSRPSPEADASANWLLDTSRDYFEQLAAYKAFQEGAA